MSIGSGGARSMPNSPLIGIGHGASSCILGSAVSEGRRGLTDTLVTQSVPPRATVAGQLLGDCYPEARS
jgi:hypothetical protein